jgi:hypothetical protein
VSNVYILSSLFLPSLPDCVDDGEGAAGAARAGAAVPGHTPRREAAELLSRAHGAQEKVRTTISLSPCSVFLILLLPQTPKGSWEKSRETAEAAAHTS